MRLWTLTGLMLLHVTTASQSFGGSSLYFLPGLSDSDQDYYIDTLASYGAKVIRLWVNGLGTGCVKGSNVVTGQQEFETNNFGSYNWPTLANVDKVLAKMAAKGMKAIISPHDGNVIHDGSVSGNGCDIYCKKYGTGFYGNTEAQGHIDARYKAILTYKSPSSGKLWGNWSEAIMAFDIENEPFQFTSDGANNDPHGWLCGRANNMKSYIYDSNIKIATGGIGGDISHNHNMLPAALQCSSIDIMSVHAYVGSASSWGSYLPNYESQCASNNKLLQVEEWGVATNYKDNFNTQVAAINSQGIPWVYWQFVPGSDGTQSCSNGCCSGYDGFEIGLKSGKGNIHNGISGANAATSKQSWDFVGAPPNTTTPPPPPPGGGDGGNGYPADTCKWGCEGWRCSSSSPCQSAYQCTGGYCKNCSWGCGGWSCSSSQPCNADYTCISGVCHHAGPAT